MDEKRHSSMKDFWDQHPELPFRTELHWSFQRAAELLAPHIRGKRVLEIGCGAGVLSAFYARHGADVTAIDFSETMIEQAQRQFGNVPNLRFVRGDVLRVDLSERFDVVTGFAILHEIEAKETPHILDFFDRHLRPRGIGFFQENSFFNPLFRFARKHIVGRYGTRKLGSELETPFDPGRYAAYRNHFKYCVRSCETFVAAERFACQIVPWAPSLFRVATKLDQMISRTGDNSMTRLWSYHQNVFFSHAVSKDEFFAGG